MQTLLSSVDLKKEYKVGETISDYVLSAGSPAGVFVVAKHDKEQHYAARERQAEGHESAA